MALLRRLGRGRGGPGAVGRTGPSDAQHLAAWAADHHGVEAFVEPPSAALKSFTVVLVAHDGEWTRRRLDGAKAVRRMGKELSIPVYDVGRVGYPQRMRDHDARLRVLRRRARRADLD